MDSMDQVFAKLELAVKQLGVDLRSEIGTVRNEVSQTRAESAMRGEENAHRLDKIDSRLNKMEGDDKAIRHEVQGLSQRMGGFESRLAKLEDDQATAKRKSIEGDEAQAAALTSAIAIQNRSLADQRVEMLNGFKAVREEIKASTVAQSTAIGTQTAALSTIGDDVKKAVTSSSTHRTVTIAVVAGIVLGVLQFVAQYIAH